LIYSPASAAGGNVSKGVHEATSKELLMGKRKTKTPAREADFRDLALQDTRTRGEAAGDDARIRELLLRNRVLERKNRLLLEDSDRLEELVLRLQEENRSVSAALFRRAEHELKRENFHYVLGLLHAVLIREPENFEAMINLAVVFVELGYRDKAVDVLKTILEKDPNHETAQRDLIRLTENR
jgi:tetratricopeptide (TPR) repeat protein